MRAFGLLCFAPTGCAQPPTWCCVSAVDPPFRVSQVRLVVTMRIRDDDMNGFAIGLCFVCNEIKLTNEFRRVEFIQTKRNSNLRFRDTLC